MRLPALACPCNPAPELAYLHPKLTASASGWAGAHVPCSHLVECATTSSWRRQPSRSASARCTNPVLRHAHTSRAFDKGEPYLKSNRLRRQAFKLIYKNGAAD
jgi:hypothetical protein